MTNWYTNIILISGPSEDVSVLYKSLEEYDAEHTASWMKDWNLVNIGSWIKAKFSDKLPEFTEKDYELSYRNFIEDYIYIIIQKKMQMIKRLILLYILTLRLTYVCMLWLN